jgi:hypothetical protein
MYVIARLALLAFLPACKPWQSHELGTRYAPPHGVYGVRGG